MEYGVTVVLFQLYRIWSCSDYLVINLCIVTIIGRIFQLLLPINIEGTQHTTQHGIITVIQLVIFFKD